MDHHHGVGGEYDECPKCGDGQPLTKQHRIAVRDNRDMTWRWASDADMQTPRIKSQLRSCGIAVVGPLMLVDIDDPATDHVELDEDKELIVCEDCGCLEPRVHKCNVAVA
jgi:hypothetical protein